MPRIHFLSGTCLLLLALSASAQSGGPYQLRRTTLEGGGGTSAGGAYRLTGSIAQAEANPVAVGGPFVLQGGFWTPSESTPREQVLFADGFEAPP